MSLPGLNDSRFQALVNAAVEAIEGNDSVKTHQVARKRNRYEQKQLREEKRKKEIERQNERAQELFAEFKKNHPDKFNAFKNAIKDPEGFLKKALSAADIKSRSFRASLGATKGATKTIKKTPERCSLCALKILHLRKGPEINDGKMKAPMPLCNPCGIRYSKLEKKLTNAKLP